MKKILSFLLILSTSLSYASLNDVLICVHPRYWRQPEISTPRTEGVQTRGDEGEERVSHSVTHELKILKKDKKRARFVTVARVDNEDLPDQQDKTKNQVSHDTLEDLLGDSRFFTGEREEKIMDWIGEHIGEERAEEFRTQNEQAKANAASQVKIRGPVILALVVGGVYGGYKKRHILKNWAKRMFKRAEKAPKIELKTAQ